VASLPVRDGRAEWSRRDASGKRVAPGLYGVREAGRRASIGKILLR
jgi:hypothetical protein